MNEDSVDRMFKAFREFETRAVNIPDFENAAEVGTLPPPWFTWMIVGVALYRRRQVWARKVIRKILLPSFPGFESAYKGKHYLDGIVPGLPEWEFEFWGEWRSCALNNRVTGETIYLSSIEPGSGNFVTESFIEQLKTRRESDAISRLLQLFPSEYSALWGLRDVEATGLIFEIPIGEEDTGFMLGTELKHHLRHIWRFCEAWNHPAQRLSAAIVIADWLSVHVEAVRTEQKELIAFAQPRAEECRRRWVNRIRHKINTSGLGMSALHALHDAGAKQLTHYLRRAMTSSIAPSAVQLIDKLDDPSFCPAVFDYFSARESIDIAAARFLLRHNHRRDEVLAVFKQSRYLDGEALMLLLEEMQDEAISMIERILRSDRTDRIEAAAVLGGIDQEWSRRMLLEVLDQCSDGKQTEACRAALRHSANAEAREAVERWESTHPTAVTSEVDYMSEEQGTQLAIERYAAEALRLRRRFRAAG